MFEHADHRSAVGELVGVLGKNSCKDGVLRGQGEGMAARPNQDEARKYQLPLQTTDLIVAFMVWVILSTLLPFIREDIPLSSTTAAWVTAIPVILGSVLRIPFGFFAGEYGAKKVYIASFVALLFPICFISFASTARDLMIGGAFLGVAGAIFSVGVTSLPRYYPKHRQGFVNGVYGLGNGGTALTTFLAPTIATVYDWHLAIRLYLILVLVVVLLNIVFGDRNEAKLKSSFGTQFRAIRSDARLWMYSLFYFVSFGAFVALSMIIPDFLVSHYALDKVAVGVIAGIFIVLAASLRIVGGWLGDRYGAYALLVLFYAGMVVGAILLSFSQVLSPFLGGLFLIGMCCGLANGVVYKLVPQSFPDQIGIASGFVAMVGGFGGFFPPLVLSYFFLNAGTNEPAFLLFAITAFFCCGIALVQGIRQGLSFRNRGNS